MSVHPPRLRLLIATIISMLMHAALIGAGDLPQLLDAAPAPKPKPKPSPPLQAHLLPARSSEPLLKNTLTEVAEQQREQRQLQSPPARSGASASMARNVAHKTVRAAQRKLAEHLFYPPQAIAAGLEGEVRLLLSLAPDGAILDARIVSSSGHSLLDHAALNAVLAMRRLPDTGVAELILPVVFQLQ